MSTIDEKIYAQQRAFDTLKLRHLIGPKELEQLLKLQYEKEQPRNRPMNTPKPEPPTAQAAGSEGERWMVTEYEDAPPELWLVSDVMRCIKQPGDSGWVQKLNKPYRMDQIATFDRLAPTQDGAVRIRVTALRKAVKDLEDRILAVEALSPNAERTDRSAGSVK